ncbi:Folate-sensitive fragile site protein Fra10Ac1 protein [Dioscorea alata]|uniref:Folate-sensitive fragile site protein Fra10Ac1 protein n=1 Tax=Dioscorea alata TaxID=55571 RepID=A0ACB7UXN5_DIOAL|nr:Folate-sensitive fragile site protein Fra10Ac1 protein [Dioscorea alata]
MASLGSLKSAIFDKEERKLQYQSHIRGLNAYDRHKKFINDYVRFYGNSKNTHENLPIKTDQDTIRENYRFIVNEEDDMDSTWEKRLVKRYYDKLFKEYCIADMSHYKKGKIGLRWRTEKEVVSGKGQFVCGNKHCDEKDGLGSYEVNFSYLEAGENKQALVKLVACKRCAEKLVYKRQKEKERSEAQAKDKEKRKRERTRHDESSEDGYSSNPDKRKKGKKTSSSTTSKKRRDEEDFDEFLEGMFL